MQNSRFVLALAMFLMLASFAANAQSSAWVDIVPMTRQLLGADDAQDISLAVGWSSATQTSGWRTLVGFQFGQETQDSFGTTITTRNNRFDWRAGRRWAAGNPDEVRPMHLFVGTDLVLGHDLLRTESRNQNFSSTNSTRVVESGLSGVLGIQWELSKGFRMVTEVRMDAVYIIETDRITDNFSGEFKEVDEGWQARLTPPLQLMLVLDL